MKLRKIITLTVIGGLISGGIYYGYVRHLRKQSEKAAIDAQSPDKLYKIVRGDMIIGVRLSGDINTEVKHKLSLQVPVSTKLVAVVEENTKVNKGDVVARFETEDLQTRIDDAIVELSNKMKDFQILEEERSILISSNAADIKTAEDAVATAEQECRKFRKLAGPHSKESKDSSVNEAYKTLVEAQDTYDTAYTELNNPTDVAKDETEEKQRKTTMETAKKALEKAESAYKTALYERKVFKRYTYPQDMKDVIDKLEQKRLTLRKEMVRTQSSLTQKNNQLYNAKISIRRLQRSLEQNLWYMSQMQLVAPVSGIITYGDPDRRRWSKMEVKVGMDVHRKVVLITIPDMSQMVVNANIPEVYCTRVSPGNQVIITPDAIPNLKIRGTVASIATLPVNRIPWDESSEKIYPAKIKFSSEDSRIVSGMSVQVEVVSSILKDVISVPVEAVHEKDGKFFVYRKSFTGPESVVVDLGPSNDNSVEIRSGLEEGDEVFLYRPFDQEKKE